MSDYETFRLAFGVMFVLIVASMTLEAAFTIDRWMWWRRTRGSYFKPTDVILIGGGGGIGDGECVGVGGTPREVAEEIARRDGGAL